MFKGDIGGVGQAPERRNALSLAPTWRGHSAWAQERLEQWVAARAAASEGQALLSLPCCGATTQPFAG